MITMETQEIRISSKTENLTVVETFVDEVCEEFKINEDYYGNILIALTEAVTNAIQHGNKYDPEKNIDLQFIPKEKELIFTIKDQGSGFDFNNLPDPTEPENIEKLHGRGIYLMKHLADKVEFSDNGRAVELNFSISAN
ncbi:MAG: ATP-binding protein [Flavobacteriales bacterium]|nr:ATP-binding protein [Flavobacteriales bacterium]